MAQVVGGERRGRIVGCTALALVAFAVNSLLGRAALGDGSIDPASFTAVRLASGAAVLGLLVVARRGGGVSRRGDWISGFVLFAYAVAFSFSYLRIPAGAGALILIGGVQLTMVGRGLVAGERLGIRGWSGSLVALGGLAYLVSPGLSAPSPLGSAFMGAAGIAWGVYSLRGRGAANPLGETAGNFLRASLFGIGIGLVAIGDAHLTLRGTLLALASGGIASGLGYAVWYAALPGLSASRAGIVQLAVPVLVAVGGVPLLDEPFTTRLAIASAVILGGVALAIGARRPS